MHYLLILGADALLALCFVFQKKYQSIAGTSARATLTFNAFAGLATFVIFVLLGICGIYKITNLKTQESYIGKSTNIKTRWTNHIKTALGLDGMARTKIHSAMKEYGIDNFTFEVLEECTKENYSEKEKYWINFYETNIYGYNIKK